MNPIILLWEFSLFKVVCHRIPLSDDFRHVHRDWALMDVENILSHLVLSEMVVLKEDNSPISSHLRHGFLKLKRVEGK
jgi:hypothetical protein